MSDKPVKQPENAIALSLQAISYAVAEKVMVSGNLAELSPEQRLEYYRGLCTSLGLNPLTRPFEYITLNNKLTLYAKKDATEQLRKLYEVSIIIESREVVNDTYVVVASAKMGTRTDSSIGAVSIKNLSGDALANAIMKAETKAKRRVTLSICGLGLLDETEIETIPAAKPFQPLPDVPTKQTKKADVIDHTVYVSQKMADTALREAGVELPVKQKSVEQMLAKDPLEKLKEFDNQSDQFAKIPEKQKDQVQSADDIANLLLPEDQVEAQIIVQDNGSVLLEGTEMSIYSTNEDGSPKSLEFHWKGQRFFSPKNHITQTDKGVIISKWLYEKNREKLEG